MTTVLQITGSWLIRTETWLYQQVRNLPPEIENHIFCEYTQNLDLFPLPNITSLKTDGGAAFYWQKALRRLGVTRGLPFSRSLAGRIDADVVHSHFGPVGWQNAGWARRDNRAHVVSFYGYDVGMVPRQDPKWRTRYQQMFRETTRFLCEGPFMKQSVAELGCDPDKIIVHRLGIDAETIEFREHTWDGNGPLKVLLAASFREKKGFPLGMRALAKVAKQVPLQITLVGNSDGTPASDAEKARILHEIEAGGLGEAVTMPGYVKPDQLRQYSYDHHVFLAPSITASDGDCEGGLPVALIEMAASGMPVIASTHCDIPELIKHQETGLLFQEGDADALAEQVLWMAGHTERWPEMSAAARRHIETEFDCTTQGRRLGAIYQSLA